MHWQSIRELSEQIHSGAVSPVALVEALLSRIEKLNPALNAFRLIPTERVLGAARAAETAIGVGEDWGPLHGIPFAAKDIIDVRGLATTAGSNALADNIAASDATVVARLRRSGMVLIGKTQTVQFAMGAPGVNHHHGTPHNPWAEVHHVPGGSSSGSAVAVAAGLVPVALGTDTGGSVRIPAGLCGTVGLKTTVGQVSRAGVFPLSSTFDSVGPLTRTVADAAWAYAAMHGQDARDVSTDAAVNPNVLESLEDGVRGLRIGVPETVFFDDLDPDVKNAVNAAIEVLAGLGANVERLAFPEAQRALDANPRRIISSVEGCYAHEEILGPSFDGYDPALAARVADGRNASAVDYVRAREACAAVAAEAHNSMRDIDVLVAPTTAWPAMPLSIVDGTSEGYTEWNRLYARNTSIGNVLGLCAVTLPCGFTESGLPVGLMVQAKGYDEAMALRVSNAYERATNWHRSHPALGWAGADE